jgi:DNA mismatch endonuclease (patch repair protein)
MVDLLSPEKRSWNMSRIRSKNTKPEMIVRSVLHRMGYRFRLHRKDLPGNPDIVLPKYKIVIFVHGCFWHQHVGCIHGGIPKSRQEYWGPKLNKNIERDKLNQKKLKEIGWKFLIIWECQINNTATIITQFKNFLAS